MDDARAGLVLRALRRRRRLRQSDVAAAAGVSQSCVSRFERGHLDTLCLRTIRAILGVVDARLLLDPRWRGGDVDRLLDDRHATTVATVTKHLVVWGWAVATEVTFAVYGERGSVDVLGWEPVTASAAVVEVKTSIVSFEQLQRSMDVKVRLASGLVLERFGQRPMRVGRILVVDDTATNRRRVERQVELFAVAMPVGSVAVKRWLRRPSGALRGMWFLSPSTPRSGIEDPVGTHRVRRPRDRCGERG